MFYIHLAQKWVAFNVNFVMYHKDSKFEDFTAKDLISLEHKNDLNMKPFKGKQLVDRFRFTLQHRCDKDRFKIELCIPNFLFDLTLHFVYCLNFVLCALGVGCEIPLLVLSY